MKQQITIKVDSTLKYLNLWNGIFNLTGMEMKVLAALIQAQQSSKSNNLCSKENKKVAADKTGFADYNVINNYVKKFKDKGAIKKVGQNYQLNRLLKPDTTDVGIKIHWIEGGGGNS